MLASLFPMLKVRDVTLIIDKQVILNKISLDCSEGTLTTFIGNNGAGKTSLFEVISGYVKPSSGNITYNTNRITPHQVGFARDELIGYTELSLSENLKFLLDLYAIKKKDHDYVNYLVAILGLDSVKHTKLQNLSRGYQQKANLVLTMATNPVILILDEPNANLDPVHSKDLKNVLAELKKDKIILVSTHHGSELIDLSDQIITIKAGNLEQCVTEQEKIKEYYSNYVSTGI